MRKIFAVFLVLPGLVGSAWCAETYVALDGGRSVARDACAGVGAGASCEDSATAWGVGAGVREGAFGAEVWYRDLGKVSASHGSAWASIRTSTFELLGVARVPVWGRVSAVGKLGAYRADQRADSNVVGLSGHDVSTGLVFGVGAEVRVTERLAGTFSALRRKDVGGATTGKSDVDSFTLGATLRF